jgi:hypothetical protein
LEIQIVTRKTTQKRRIAACLVFLMVWTSSAPLHADSDEPAPSLALVGFRATDAPLESQARSGLLKSLENSTKVRLVSETSTTSVVEAIWKDEKGGDSSVALDRAYKSYVEGKQLYEKLALEEAITSLSAAVRGYREGVGALRDNRYLLVSHLYLGMALIILGREQEGRKYIREMVVLDASRKKRKLPPREFSPKIITLHRSLTNEVLKGPMGQVVVDTKPSGATILLDGVIQKPSPISIAEVPAGEHFLVAEMKGYRQYSRRILVGTGLNKINVNLDEWNPLAPVPVDKRKDLATIEMLSRLSSQLDAQVLLLGNLSTMSNSDGLLAGQLFDARSKEFSKIEKIESPMGRLSKASSDLASKLLGNVMSSGSVLAEVNMALDGPPPADFTAPKERPVKQYATGSESEEKSIFQKWWFWALLGGVAAGGAGAYYKFGRKDPNHNVLNVTNPLAP